MKFAVLVKNLVQDLKGFLDIGYIKDVCFREKNSDHDIKHYWIGHDFAGTYKKSFWVGCNVSIF